MVKKQTKSILNPEKSLSIRRYCLKLRHNSQNNFPHPKIRSYSQQELDDLFYVFENKEN